MRGATPEPRTAVKILVEASWHDQAGSLQVAAAWMEDKSSGGACIRLKTPVRAGIKLNLQGRWEQLSGTVKYCRTDGSAYVVGIQRDSTTNFAGSAAISGRVPLPEPQETNAVPAAPSVSAGAVEVETPEPKAIVLTASSPKTEPTIPPAKKLKPIEKARRNEREIAGKMTSIPEPIISRPIISRPSVPRPVIRRKGRKLMQKWSELLHRPNGKAGEPPNGNGRNVEPHAVLETPAQEKPFSGASRVELLRVEDIYRAAGIMNPASGYSVGKIIQMMHSDYMRELAPEARRAAVLMALDAAHVRVEEVLRDAKARQDALESYEGAQKKAMEAEWKRKTEENSRIEEELERVKQRYAARINGNIEGVAREKAAFSEWSLSKQQEFESIAEAVELCRPSAPREPKPAVAEIAVVASPAK